MGTVCRLALGGGGEGETSHRPRDCSLLTSLGPDEVLRNPETDLAQNRPLQTLFCYCADCSAAAAGYFLLRPFPPLCFLPTMRASRHLSALQIQVSILFCIVPSTGSSSTFSLTEGPWRSPLAANLRLFPLCRGEGGLFPRNSIWAGFLGT